ncbi:MAG: sigma-70 family RNA polymerase sigma factor [Ruminococcus sp.]|nr:sigma-70 family RNA polymerase sigma factor [Ruminococcus sp.]
MSEDLKDQYEKIFRYCYFRVRDKSLAEDLTQETFLRFLEICKKQDIIKVLHYLYTIAGNLCADSYRRKDTEELTDDIPDDSDREDDILTGVALGNAIKKLDAEDREIIMLRYINEVPVGTLSKIKGVSRFAMSRRINRILAELKKDLEEMEG